MNPMSPSESIQVVTAIHDSRRDCDRWTKAVKNHKATCHKCAAHPAMTERSCLAGYCIHVRYVEAYKVCRDLSEKYAKRKALENQWEVTN